jgi:protein-L-isoaspartate(D-aspartate) O-methyltransferase
MLAGCGVGIAPRSVQVWAMRSIEEMDNIRREHAGQTMAQAGVEDSRIEDAIASVAKEAFLGPPPWEILPLDAGFELRKTSDQADLYGDCLVVIDRKRGINCGQPALHARLMAHAAPQDGDHIVHIGAGLGYYTAILARLAGQKGRVTAIEVAPDLARRATANLSGFGNVEVKQGDGTTMPLTPANVIYMNAGVARPAEPWLDALRPGGRLILPLTVNAGIRQALFGQVDRQGAVFLITRTGEAFDAKWISPVAIYRAIGARDRASDRALLRAFESGDYRDVRHLRRGTDAPKEACWLKAPDWALTYD